MLHKTINSQHSGETLITRVREENNQYVIDVQLQERNGRQKLRDNAHQSKHMTLRRAKAYAETVHEKAKSHYFKI